MSFVLRLIARIIASGIALVVISFIFPTTFEIAGNSGLLAAAIIIGLLNTFLRPVLHWFSTPLRWVTFGLFNIVIHVFLLWVADLVLPELVISQFSTLVLSALLIALANSLLP